MMNEEEQRYIARVENELENERLNVSQARKEYGQISMYSSQENTNLIQWQLDLREELERLDHLLRGHLIVRDATGNEYWDEPKDTDMKPFNDNGVQLIMNVISFYLNRNTILSNYDEKWINIKMTDLSTEMADLILLKYEEMGMDTHDKRKLFPMLLTFDNLKSINCKE